MGAMRIVIQIGDTQYVLFSATRWAYLCKSITTEMGGASRHFSKDASFLLTIEVFLLTVRLFYLRWGNRKQKRPNPISGGGGNRKQKDPTYFPDRGEP